jgi:sigma-E factor negative regulatory protein RseC
MTNALTLPTPPTAVEGYARVVALAGDVVWLVPEQTTSCGHCAASASCGAPGIGTLASRLEARRFALPNTAGLQVGDHVVVGIASRALLIAALVAYGLPLLVGLGAGVLVHLQGGSDLTTFAAMAGGLLAGLFASRIAVRHLERDAALSPHFLRRIAAGDACHGG